MKEVSVQIRLNDLKADFKRFSLTWSLSPWLCNDRKKIETENNTTCWAKHLIIKLNYF